jgi:CBS domain containing-hemolysin-like protein
MSWGTLIFWTFFCLAMEAFFSGSELALVTADKLRLTHRAARGHPGAKMALTLASQPDWFFSATLLGQNLFIVANSILVTFFIFDRYGMEYEFFGIVLSPLILIFGEAVPKSLFQQWADRLAPVVSPFVLLFSYLFFPVVWPLSKLTLLLMGGVKGSLLSGHEVTAESLEILLRESEIPRDLSPLFKKSLLKILAFPKRETHEIMTPLIEVFSLRETTTVEEAIRLCREEGYSSLPVFQKRAYNIIGVVNFFRLLFAPDLKAPVGSLIEEPLYVPPHMSVKDLFPLFRDGRKNFAVVVDEYGAAVGIVTLEDIMEEVVGEIQDEYDEERVTWKRLSPTQYLLKGRTTIDEINDRLRWGLPKGNCETLAGLLLTQFGRFPKTGEVLHYGNLTFLVKTATPRSIDEVLVELE